MVLVLLLMGHTQPTTFPELEPHAPWGRCWRAVVCITTLIPSVGISLFRLCSLQGLEETVPQAERWCRVSAWTPAFPGR